MKCVLLGNDFLAVTSEGRKGREESALEMFSGALGKMNLLAIEGSGNLLGVKTEVACGAVMRRGSTAAPASYIDFLEVSQSLRGVDLTVRDNPGGS